MSSNNSMDTNTMSTILQNPNTTTMTTSSNNMDMETEIKNLRQLLTQTQQEKSASYDAVESMREHLVTALGQLSAIQQALDSKLLRKGVTRSMAITNKDKQRRAHAEEILLRNKAVLLSLTHAVADLPSPVNVENFELSPENVVALPNSSSITTAATQSSSTTTNIIPRTNTNHNRPFSLASITNSLTASLTEMAESVKEKAANVNSLFSNLAGVTNDGSSSAAITIAAVPEQDNESEDEAEFAAAIAADDAPVYNPLLLSEVDLTSNEKTKPKNKVTIMESISKISTLTLDNAKVHQLLRKVTRTTMVGKYPITDARAYTLSHPKLLAYIFLFFSHVEVAKYLLPVCRAWRVIPLRSNLELSCQWSLTSTHYISSSSSSSSSQPSGGKKATTYETNPSTIVSHGLEPSIRSGLWSALSTANHAPLAVNISSKSRIPTHLFISSTCKTSPPHIQTLFLHLAVLLGFPALYRWYSQRSPLISSSTSHGQILTEQTMNNNKLQKPSNTNHHQTIQKRRRSLSRVYCDSESEEDEDEEEEEDEASAALADTGRIRSSTSGSGIFTPSLTPSLSMNIPTTHSVFTPLSCTMSDWRSAVQLRPRTLLKILFLLSAEGSKALRVQAKNINNTTTCALPVGRTECAPLRLPSAHADTNANTLRLSNFPSPVYVDFGPTSNVEASVAASAAEALANTIVNATSSNTVQPISGAAAAIAAAGAGSAAASALVQRLAANNDAETAGNSAPAVDEASWKILLSSTNNNGEDEDEDEDDFEDDNVESFLRHNKPSEAIFRAYASAGCALRLACDEIARVNAVAVTVRTARASVNNALSQIQSAADSDTPLDANISVKYASACDAVIANEAELMSVAETARNAITHAHVACATADSRLVRIMFHVWSEYISDLSAAWINHRIRDIKDMQQALTAQYFSHPASGRLVPTDGFCIPSATIPSNTTTSNTVVELYESLRKVHTSIFNESDISRPPYRPRCGSIGSTPGNTIEPGYVSLHPLLPLPPRLADVVVAAALIDFDIEEEAALGLDKLELEAVNTSSTRSSRIVVRPPPGPVKVALGSPADGISLLPPSVPDEPVEEIVASGTMPQSLIVSEVAARKAARSLLQRSPEENTKEKNENTQVASDFTLARPPWTTLILPGLPVDMQHTLIDADVKRTFGDLEAIIRTQRLAQLNGTRATTPSLGVLFPTAHLDSRTAAAELSASTVAILRYRLRKVLLAYAAFDSDCGYCQGANFLTATILLHTSKPSDAFWGLSNLLFSPELRFAEVFSTGLSRVALSFNVLNQLMKHHIPAIFSHFSEQRVIPDMYAAGWIMTLFSSRETLPLNYIVPIWDTLFTGLGWKIIYRIILALLDSASSELLTCDFATIVQYLHKYPSTKLPSTPTQLLHQAMKFKVTRKIIHFLEQKHLALKANSITETEKVSVSTTNTTSTATSSNVTIVIPEKTNTSSENIKVPSSPNRVSKESKEENNQSSSIKSRRGTESVSSISSKGIIESVPDVVSATKTEQQESERKSINQKLDLSNSISNTSTTSTTLVKSASVSADVHEFTTSSILSPENVVPTLHRSQSAPQAYVSHYLHQQQHSHTQAGVFDDGGLVANASIARHRGSFSRPSAFSVDEEDNMITSTWIADAEATSASSDLRSSGGEEGGVIAISPAAWSNSSLDSLSSKSLPNLSHFPLNTSNLSRNDAAAVLGTGIPVDVGRAIAAHNISTTSSRATTTDAAIKGRLSSSSAGAPIAAPIMAARLFANDPLAGGVEIYHGVMETQLKSSIPEDEELDDSAFDRDLKKRPIVTGNTEDDDGVAEATAAAADAEEAKNELTYSQGKKSNRKNPMRFLKRLIPSTNTNTTTNMDIKNSSSTTSPHTIESLASIVETTEMNKQAWDL